MILPNVHGSGVSPEGIAYIIMELLEGHSLAMELAGQGKLSVLRSCEIAYAVCTALAEAHRVGIIHRDVKPENIFLHRVGSDEIVKVVDFGAATLQASLDGQTAAATGMIGTPVYMAPERLDHGIFDGRSDVYSLGVVLYELLCGRPPFVPTGDNIWSLVKKHLSEPPPPLRELDPGTPEIVAAVCLRALAKRPEQRPTAEALSSELASAIAALSADQRSSEAAVSLADGPKKAITS